MGLLVLWGVAAHNVRLLGQEGPLAAPDRLVGNVYGTVRDAVDGRPVAGARVFLLTEREADPASTPLETEPLRRDGAPDPRSAARVGVSDLEGRFLINSVPAPFPHRDYSIALVAKGFRGLVIEGARVLPGAVMALEVDARLTRGEGEERRIRRSDANRPVRYRHEVAAQASNAAQRPMGRQGGGPVARTVFATREGLVGGTTANGHVIVDNDRFVALPSRRALNANDSTYHYQVEISFEDKTVTAPVWDIGPWNTRDDYWNPPEIREFASDLPQWLPEAQAAFQNGYNDGLDGGGREVLNPAGIDLGDGTFREDLALRDNSWVSVSFLWLLAAGDRVRVDATTLNVRSAPGSSTVAYKETGGAFGTVTDGPRGATLNGTYYVWWQVRWDDQPDNPGWSAEAYLAKVLEVPVPESPVLSLRVVGGQPTLTVLHPAGGRVEIQTTVALGAMAAWTTVTNFTMDAEEQVWTDPLLSEDARFYRALAY